MNNARRKQIDDIVARLESVKSLAEQIASDLADIMADEQESFDNMPESLQYGERGQKSQDSIDNLENAHSELESVIIAIDETQSYLQSASE